MSQFQLPICVSPLSMIPLEEQLPTNVSHEPGDVALMFLADTLDERVDPLGAMRTKYVSVSGENRELQLVPMHGAIINHVVRPLREAKLCYVLGMPIACIAQAGLVGEMVAIWRFQMLRPGIDSRLQEDSLNKIMKNRSFDELGQERRVDVLKRVDQLDDETKQAFGELRSVRRQYLHFMVDDPRNVDDDAKRALRHANTLVAKTLDASVRDGMLLFPPKVMSYIKADREMVDYVAGRIADADAIRRSRQFPYQFLAAYMNAASEVPQKIKAALHEAAEIACGNVPELPGPIVIGLDTSGSMGCSVSGWRGRGATSNMRCVDVAALFAAAILRRNPDSVVIPFDTQAYKAQVDPGDTILSLSKRLARYGGGGTNCSLPLHEANTTYRNRKFAGCVLVSDNESWVGRGHYGSTGVMSEWQAFVKNQMRLGGHGIPAPKLVCIDIQPYGSTQAPERADILNVGGFSDAVFNVVASYLSGDAARFVAEVESIEL